jgi:PPOX class probable F420-dependent enzyme
MNMAYELDPDHRTFLDDHVWSVLATGRADGSPQQSMVGYVVDSEGRLVISAKAYTAKWKNAVRQPKVCVTVPDDRRHLVVYGTAEAIDADPARAELTAAVFTKMSGNEVDPATLSDMLDQQERTVLRVTPTKALFQA